MLRWTLATAALSAVATATPPSVHDIQAPLQRIGFGSCNDQSMEQPLWPAIINYDPELWVWMGDNIYADIKEQDQPSGPPRWIPGKMFTEATPEVLRYRYAKQLSHPKYSEFVKKTPIVGIWDDHDFGINDGHKGYSYREESQQIFLDYMNEPADSPRRKQEGVYASYTVGSGEKTVKFILVDNRYHRDEYHLHDGDFLGEAQWAWLENELATSDAAFNVIVSGIQILPADRFFPAESWSRFPHQRERLIKSILSSHAKGVILLSGDVHFAEINQIVCSDGRNVLTEMTSSGMTHSWMQFHFRSIKFFPALLFTFANMLLPWEFRPQHDSLYGYLNWGMIDIDWDHADHPVAHVRVRGQDDQVKLQFDVPSVSFHSDSAASDAELCQPPRLMGDAERLFWRVVMMGSVTLMLLSILFNGVVALWLVYFFLTKLLGTAKKTPAKTTKTD
ncbi:hypothetical protein Poli38472_002350 [Pythium oligandrum]|uniref:PhoD-like phosphatase metallophosphatase domain-containing protein n=1 Tax=Pythium oligandrum TaxID=41045 RepID=A0A8K1CHZ4_PYTOL|nr:hypothetical protein Poli38472_002350 [Pythium oligandrum]|eukprot:TMW63409.1 hypothetical protein Poli38472_002350 [Pythium oligandrum]